MISLFTGVLKWVLKQRAESVVSPAESNRTYYTPQKKTFKKTSHST